MIEENNKEKIKNINKMRDIVEIKPSLCSIIGNILRRERKFYCAGFCKIRTQSVTN